MTPSNAFKWTLSRMTRHLLLSRGTYRLASEPVRLSRDSRPPYAVAQLVRFMLCREEMHTSLKSILLVPIAFVLFTPSARAESDTFQLWGGGGYNSSAIAGDRIAGGKLIGGIRFPGAPTDKLSIRTSLSRSFDRSDLTRYALLVHAGYRLLPSLELAVMGGVGYLDRESTNSGYVKPVVGVEVLSCFLTSGRYQVSAFAAYEVFRGSTGTLALDGGSTALTTRSISVGFVLAYDLFHETVVRQP